MQNYKKIKTLIMVNIFATWIYKQYVIFNGTVKLQKQKFIFFVSGIIVTQYENDIRILKKKR